MVTVYTGFRPNVEEQWCNGCADQRSFLCSASGDRFANYYATSIRVGGVIVCYDRYSDQLYQWDDGDYHWEPEPEEEEEDVIPSYHSLERPWLCDGMSSIPVDAIGVELEMRSRRCEAVANVATDLGLLAERDGSLDDHEGIEIIGPPMTFRDYHKNDNPWMKFLNHKWVEASKGWDAGTGYGLHVSLDRRNISDIQLGKMQSLVHNHQPQCEAIAGRDATNYAKYHYKGSIVPRRFDGHYHAINCDDPNRLEIRIFRSTLMPSGFLRCVEFGHAVRSFTRDVSIRDITWPKFCRFVSNGANQYRNLIRTMSAKGVMTPCAY